MSTETKSKTVTSLISRSIKPGYEKDYDDWLRRFLEFERKALGYLQQPLCYRVAQTLTFGTLSGALLIRLQWIFGISRIHQEIEISSAPLAVLISNVV